MASCARSTRPTTRCCRSRAAEADDIHRESRANQRFPCDCCGHWTLAAAPDGESLQSCAVCGWEDSEHWRGGELALDLLVAQRAFVDGGVAVPLLRDQVRRARLAPAYVDVYA